MNSDVILKSSLFPQQFHLCSYGPLMPSVRSCNVRRHEWKQRHSIYRSCPNFWLPLCVHLILEKLRRTFRDEEARCSSQQPLSFPLAAGIDRKRRKWGTTRYGQCGQRFKAPPTVEKSIPRRPRPAWCNHGGLHGHMVGMWRSVSMLPQSEGKTPIDQPPPSPFYHFKLQTAGVRTYSCGRHLPAGRIVQLTMKPSDGSAACQLFQCFTSPPVSPGRFGCLTLKPPGLFNLPDSAHSSFFFIHFLLTKTQVVWINTGKENKQFLISVLRRCDKMWEPCPLLLLSQT